MKVQNVLYRRVKKQDGTVISRARTASLCQGKHMFRVWTCISSQGIPLLLTIWKGLFFFFQPRQQIHKNSPASSMSDRYCYCVSVLLKKVFHINFLSNDESNRASRAAAVRTSLYDRPLDLVRLKGASCTWLHDENDWETCLEQTSSSKCSFEAIALAAIITKSFLRLMRLKIRLIIIMVHPMSVCGTVLAFVGLGWSVGGSPHRRMFFFLLVNYWIVLISSLHLEPKETNIHCGPSIFKAASLLPLWGSSMCCLCTMANLSSCKTKPHTHGIFRKHAAWPPFVLLLLINSTTFLLWCGKLWSLLHVSMFVFSLICIKKTGGCKNNPPLCAEEGGRGEEAGKGWILWSVLSGRGKLLITPRFPQALEEPALCGCATSEQQHTGHP